MKYLGNSESFEDSLEDSDIEDQFNEAASSYKTNDNNGDSIEIDNETFLARLNRKLDIESNHIEDFSLRLQTLKRELKSLKFESNMIGKSVMPDILIRYFTNDKVIKEKVHQLHYNTWKMEIMKKERKWTM